MDLDGVVSQFKDAKKSGNGFRAICSAHEDNTPSLSINEGPDGRVLITCHAGCSTAKVLSGVGLTFRDLYPNRSLYKSHLIGLPIQQPVASRPKPATILPDEDILQGQVFQEILHHYFEELTDNLPWTLNGIERSGVGYDPEKNRFVFFIRNPDGALVNLKHHKGPAGEPPYSIAGHGQNCIYPLQLIAGYKPDTPTIIFEGEKDVVSALSHGLQAFTGTAGATSIPPDLSPILNLETIYIWLDQGDAGKKGSIKWAESIGEQFPQKSIFICSWPDNTPDGYDVTTYFQDGHSPDDLRQLMADQCELSVPTTPVSTTQPYERSPIVIRMSEVILEPVDWVWYPYIPAGKLTILEGNPGDTKSWLALCFSATVTRGGSFPNSEGVLPDDRVRPGTVVYCTAEDGVADTLLPRLEALNADLRRIVVLDGWRMQNSQGDDITGQISLEDLSVLEKAISEHQPHLLVIDPIQAFIGSRVDINRTNEVRPILAKLGALAEKYQVAIICIRHLTKQTSQSKAIYRGQGSIDFAAAARSVLLVAPDPENANMRVIAHSKSNLTQPGISQRYEILDGSFRWQGTSDLSADELLGPLVSVGVPGALAFAEEFLLELLSGKSFPSANIYLEASHEGISRSTLLRAKRKLSIQSVRTGGVGEAGNWSWRLPDN